jgi:hypothetical protein
LTSGCSGSLGAITSAVLASAEAAIAKPTNAQRQNERAARMARVPHGLFLPKSILNE